MKRKGCWIGLGVLVLLIVGLVFTGPGQAFVDIWRTGAIQDALRKDEKEYRATTERNLKALHTAMMLYHDSEGQFPAAEGWMNAILPRLRTGDLKEGEEAKKLIRPVFNEQAERFDDHYGYVMNQAASGKYKDDVDPKIPLIYESDENWIWNAQGDPDEDGTGSYVAVDGTLGTFPK
ncbi:MAG TPA: hypothetical protein VGE01_09405 [Fimbriimonas sp.]